MTYGDIFEEAGQALAYGGVGLVLLVLGYVLVDLLTPGKLNDLIFVDRNRNAGMLVASGLLGTGLIEYGS